MTNICEARGVVGWQVVKQGGQILVKPVVS